MKEPGGGAPRALEVAVLDGQVPDPVRGLFHLAHERLGLQPLPLGVPGRWGCPPRAGICCATA